MRGVRHVDRHSGIDEPLRGGAEQTLLVDRLVGPHSLRLRRTIRRDDDERRARVGRLDDRGMKLRRRGPRRCEYDHGLPVALPRPTAKKELHRSSIWTMTLIRGWRCMAMATGAERDPGETQANSTPCAASSSTKVAAKDCATSDIGSNRDSGA